MEKVTVMMSVLVLLIFIYNGIKIYLLIKASFIEYKYIYSTKSTSIF